MRSRIILVIVSSKCTITKVEFKSILNSLIILNKMYKLQSIFSYNFLINANKF